MKKIYNFALVAAAAMLALSCSKELNDPSEDIQPKIDQDLVTMTFKAVSENSATKTSIDPSDGAVSWAVGDKVNFVWEVDKTASSDESDALTSEDIAEDGSATFTADIPATFGKASDPSVTSRHLYAVYPSSIETDYSTASSFYLTVPTTQDGSFESASIALAKWNKDDVTASLEFKNLCGLLQIVIADENVRKIVLHSDDYIAGKMDISFTGPAVKKVDGGEKAITVNVGGAGTYYVAVLPTDSSKGIGLNNMYVELYDSGDELIGDRIAKNEIPVARKQIRKLGTLATGFAGRYYVKADGEGDGSSWDNAAGLASLKTLLAGSEGKNVYIAAGTYAFEKNGNLASNGSASFSVYGGFPSDASGYSLSGRNVSENETILDGQEQARLWVVQSGTFLIDGITFYHAARLSSGSADTGSALVVEKAADKTLNVTVSNCKFTSNKNEKNGGGAVRVGGSSTPVQFTNCSFESNTSASVGGAVYVVANRSAKFTGCTFTLNSSTTQGGALRIEGTAVAENCTFATNSATTQGGAVHMNGGSFTANGCTFTGNTAESHGGTIETTDAATLRLNQCVFTDNQTTGDSSADLYIGGTTSIYANACWFGQTTTDTKIYTPATKSPHRILTGSNTTAGFNNCVISGPFGLSNSQTQLGGKAVVVNSTLYAQVGGSNIIVGAADADGCRVINSLVMNGSSGHVSITANDSKYIQVYNTIHSTPVATGTLTETDCVNNKWYTNFPESSKWAQKYLGTAATLPNGLAITAYVWDGVCTGFTANTLAGIKTLISGTTTIGSSFLEWLESDDLKVNGSEALSVDIRGNARNTSAMWPGSYEAASTKANIQNFSVK